MENLGSLGRWCSLATSLANMEILYTCLNQGTGQIEFLLSVKNHQSLITANIFGHAVFMLVTRADLILEFISSSLV